LYIEIKNLTKSFKDLTVFKDFSIRIPENKITVIIGESGCGKTTLLNILSGIYPADSGIFENLKQRTISYIFQEPRLLEWKTVKGNIEFVLKDIYPKNNRREITEKFIKLVSLERFSDYYPNQLSGGMSQRVAVARAFAFPSDILLMDEPFKQLDLKLKKDILYSFLNLWQIDKRTVIFVTHDIEEAVMLGNEIFVLKGFPARIINNIKIEQNQLERNLTNAISTGIKNDIVKIMDS